MGKTGYEQTTVDEVRRVLRDEHGIDDKEFLENTKSTLVQHLRELRSAASVPSDEAIDSVFDDIKEDADDTAMQPYTETESKEAMPSYASEAWHEYVMRKFRDDELVDNAPTCDGCRRVVEEVLGPIISSQITHLVAPNVNNNGTATVGVLITVHVTNDAHPAVSNTVICEEVADVNKDNCDHPYYKYASATASSRAEGRALRKLLRLRNIITAEEASEKAETTDTDCNWEMDEPISDSQISVLDMLCKRLDINVIDFVNSGRRVYDDIEAVNKSTAQRMIQELNRVQRKEKDQPPNINPYDPNWRTANESTN